MNNIDVKDQSKPTEVLKKNKPWFNGMHEFPTVKIETPKADPPGMNRNPTTGELQPASLGVNIGESLTAKDIPH